MYEQPAQERGSFFSVCSTDMGITISGQAIAFAGAAVLGLRRPALRRVPNPAGKTARRLIVAGWICCSGFW
jgi:hypothetical protein